MNKVVGRFAPSPSGRMHLGNVFAALLAWLSVRSQDGEMVLRIEDLDPDRCRPEYAETLKEDLRWLGLDWDREQTPQSRRTAAYAEAFSSLEAQSLVYPCYCSRARLQAIGAPHAGERSVYDGHCYGMTAAERAAMQKDPSWRVHVPPAAVSFCDGVYGRQEAYLPRACGDFVVRRADGLYAYQLAVSVDDGMMGITHVLRGRDLLSSTAQQIWLIEYLGYPAPQYTHVPMLIDGEGRRLSKRQQGITIESLRYSGADRDSVLSYLAYKGGLVSEKARYPLEELARCCDLTALRQEDIVIDDDVMQAICAV